MNRLLTEHADSDCILSKIEYDHQMSEDIEPFILKKFKIQKQIGRGAYGIVWKTIDWETNTPIALKKCFDAFRCEVDAQRIFREVSYLRFLRGHENIVKLLDVYCSNNGRDVYLAFEHFPTDLQNVLRSTLRLENKHYQYITYQLMKALKYIHDADLVHRDLKPSNILINSSCQIKICDFGLCRSISQLNDRHLTDYVATRWYRPPEVLLGTTIYDQTIDVWAAGCILGEMYCGRVLWQGHNTMNQLELILSCIEGINVDNDLDDMMTHFGKRIISNIKIFHRINLKEICINAPTDALDLMENCLAFNPRNRYSADIALSHVYFSDFHDPKGEPGYKGRPVIVTIDDNIRMSPDIYRKAIETRHS